MKIDREDSQTNNTVKRRRSARSRTKIEPTKRKRRLPNFYKMIELGLIPWDAKLTILRSPQSRLRHDPDIILTPIFQDNHFSFIHIHQGDSELCECPGKFTSASAAAECAQWKDCKGKRDGYKYLLYENVPLYNIREKWIREECAGDSTLWRKAAYEEDTDETVIKEEEGFIKEEEGFEEGVFIKEEVFIKQEPQDDPPCSYQTTTTFVNRIPDLNLVVDSDDDQPTLGSGSEGDSDTQIM
eukprot:TRINITY_DN10254_c0_g1_i1.p1 TRINITY_DN10254_c0_g1~~TRINITY_DN10254_c0_g1_i1.p1  ORF type:complete len:241 (+),score=55.30 TRINITY_DN10254_c0_g1_i1:123-845(+)